MLTNGGEKQTQKLLEAAGLADRSWTRSSRSRRSSSTSRTPPCTGTRPSGSASSRSAITLIAAHAWDVVGAKQAGLDAVWVDRLEREWPFPQGKPRSRVAHDLSRRPS